MNDTLERRVEIEVIKADIGQLDKQIDGLCRDVRRLNKRIDTLNGERAELSVKLIRLEEEK